MADDDLLTERLLRVIDEGRRTATYKLALLMALIDAAALSPGERRIPTRSIAELVLETYYPQTRVYVANDGIERELRQITMKGSPPRRRCARRALPGSDRRSAHDAHPGRDAPGERRALMGLQRPSAHDAPSPGQPRWHWASGRRLLLGLELVLELMLRAVEQVVSLPTWEARWYRGSWWPTRATARG